MGAALSQSRRRRQGGRDRGPAVLRAGGFWSQRRGRALSRDGGRDEEVIGRYRSACGKPADARSGRGNSARKRLTDNLSPSTLRSPERKASASLRPPYASAASVSGPAQRIASGRSALPRVSSSRPRATSAWKRSSPNRNSMLASSPAAALESNIVRNESMSA